MRLLAANLVTVPLIVVSLPIGAEENRATGPLRVHPNNARYFADSTGRAVFLTGSPTGSGTELEIRDTRFTLNGEPTFLLGISVYGALGAPEEFLRQDLDDVERHGFNWIRVWATWAAFDRDVSAVDDAGRPREPFLGKLKWLVAECDRRGLMVDVTLTRGKSGKGGALPDLKAHRRSVQTLVEALKARRNWYLDLANEHDAHDARHVATADLKELRELVRKLDAHRLVTASFGGQTSARATCVRLSPPLVWISFARTGPETRNPRVKRSPEPVPAWPP